VLFLDEPTTGLDPEARADLWDEIATLSREGLTILLTTHYLDEADRLAARIGIVDSGRVVVEGTPERLKAELRGDSIEVDLAIADNGRPPVEADVRDAVDHVPGIRDVNLVGTCLNARADQGATAVPAILLALEANGIKAASVKVSRPSL